MIVMCKEILEWYDDGLNKINSWFFNRQFKDFSIFPTALKSYKSLPYDLLYESEYYGKVWRLDMNVPVKIKLNGFPTEEDTIFLSRALHALNKLFNKRLFEVVTEKENLALYYAKGKDDYYEYTRKHGLREDYVSHIRIHFSGDFMYASHVVMTHNRVQLKKNMILLHELFHMLGFPHNIKNDSLKKDTIASGVYMSEGNPKGFSPTDVLAILMLYNTEFDKSVPFKEIEAYYNLHGIDNLLHLFNSRIGNGWY